jgi:L-2-hydroxyglutarate oxidase
LPSAGIIVIGGGIVGLAAAYNLLGLYPGQEVTILEKEGEVAWHQTGHNSGVLHSGIYYRPGSLKAVTCRDGRQAMKDFCDREAIPYRLCGKVIVARNESELPRLAILYERGLANGLNSQIIDRPSLRRIEPHAEGVLAIRVPETGIVDYSQVSRRLAARITEKGGKILTRAKVVGLREGSKEVFVQSTAGDFSARFVINCAGLYSDHVASFVSPDSPTKIVPFRGEYFHLRPEAERVCSGLIYPLPDPDFPFLGVHFTPTISGGVKCGPNAVLALAREGYRKRDVNFRELLETLAYPGFLRLARRYWVTGLGEMWRSFSNAAFVRALQSLVPAITPDQLVSAPAGVRAQAVARSGTLLDDFVFQETPRVLSVVNAPSPAATASLSIGRSIVERLAPRF